MFSYSLKLIQYVHDTWINGRYSVQDWNLFDINTQLVPCTNNSHENYNGKLNVSFAIHPGIYRFSLQVIEQLQFTDNKIETILMGKERGPPQNKLYRELNVEREKAKELLLERTTRVNASEEEFF